VHHDVELHLHFPKALNAAIQWRGDRPRLVTCWYLIFFVIDMNCLVVLLVLPIYVVLWYLMIELAVLLLLLTKNRRTDGRKMLLDAA